MEDIHMPNGKLHPDYQVQSPLLRIAQCNTSSTSMGVTCARNGAICKGTSPALYVAGVDGVVVAVTYGPALHTLG